MKNHILKGFVLLSVLFVLYWMTSAQATGALAVLGLAGASVARRQEALKRSREERVREDKREIERKARAVDEAQKDAREEAEAWLNRPFSR